MPALPLLTLGYDAVGDARQSHGALDNRKKRRGSTKSILERKAPPTFDVAVEIHDPQTWIIHDNIEHSVDLLLRGQNPLLQKRKLIDEKDVNIHCEISYNKNDSPEGKI